MITATDFKAVFEKKLGKSVYLGVLVIFIGLFVSSLSLIFLSNTLLIAAGFSISILGIVAVFSSDSSASSEYIKKNIEEVCREGEIQLEKNNVLGKAIYRKTDEGTLILVPIERSEGRSFTQQNIFSRMLLEDKKLMLVFNLPISSLIDLGIIGAEDNLQENLSYVIIDILESARSLNIVKRGSKFFIHLYGVEDKNINFPRCTNIWGSLQTIFIGSLIAFLLKKSVYLLDEITSGKDMKIIFEVK